MHIKLDGEQWEVADTTSMMEALADVSDKAHAKHRIVTSLRAGDRTITDRDLDPAFLARTGRDCPRIEATSKSLSAIVGDAAKTIDLFSAQLKQDGLTLLASLRSGRGGFAALDAWLGSLADYAEMLGAAQPHSSHGNPAATLIPWIQELLEARSSHDSVRVADLLEYELLTRLSPVL